MIVLHSVLLPAFGWFGASLKALGPETAKESSKSSSSLASLVSKTLVDLSTRTPLSQIFGPPILQDPAVSKICDMICGLRPKTTFQRIQ